MSEATLRIDDPHGHRVVALDKPLFTIGRRTAADLAFGGSDVSREHAEIERKGDSYLLRDVGSTCGTYVNGQRIAEHALAHGDRIRLGRSDAVELVFEATAGSVSTLSDPTSDGTDLRQLAAILDGLRAIGSGRVLNEVLALVVDSALGVTRAERGFVMLADEHGQLELKIARGVGCATLPGTSFATSTKIPREVFTTGRSRVIRDLVDGAADHAMTLAVGIRHVMCVPLRVALRPAESAEHDTHRVIGVLYLDGRQRSAMRSSATLASLEAFGTQAAIAIESARLYAESDEKARIDRDLRVAANIQRSLLAEPTFSSEICDLAAVSIPCRTIGGDFYDYLELADGSLTFALGDVAGKGPPAALLAAAVQSNFVAHASIGSDPAETTGRINTALLRRPIEARFATMFHGVLTKAGRLSYCNAGQEPPLIVHRNSIRWLQTGGPVLGLLTVATYASEIVQLHPNDLVVVCSDGVTEARNVVDEEFGRERVVEAMVRCHGGRPDAVLETLMDTVRRFSHAAAQADDITALVLRYRGE